MSTAPKSTVRDTLLYRHAALVYDLNRLDLASGSELALVARPLTNRAISRIEQDVAPIIGFLLDLPVALIADVMTPGQCELLTDLPTPRLTTDSLREFLPRVAPFDQFMQDTPAEFFERAAAYQRERVTFIGLARDSEAASDFEDALFFPSEFDAADRRYKALLTFLLAKDLGARLPCGWNEAQHEAFAIIATRLAIGPAYEFIEFDNHGIASPADGLELLVLASPFAPDFESRVLRRWEAIAPLLEGTTDALP